ncbi:DUF389 domain-containing protein [Sphingopyxis sp. R3-92]|uniref:DUF389 domain-containing protein n=1 Tax=Sphingopyxis sp. R3-92 TaxID=3158553 RepID=UPI003EE50BE4
MPSTPSQSEPTHETAGGARGWRWSLLRRIVHFRQNWAVEVANIDQAAVIAKIRPDGAWSPRFAFMSSMAAGIAILGLLQNSVAVIIGAMLIAPLMGPIMALGFAIATGDFAWMKESVRTLLGGVLLALLLCVIIVKISPIQAVTSEIAARTQPTLFDLGVALFSALAGAYAVVRGREGTIIGVAIATALMPPLAVVSFGLATGQWSIFGGALMLFFTNFMTIALSAAIVARAYGFSASLSPDQTRRQTLMIVAAFLVLAVPLGLSLRQIAWEATVQTQARAAVADVFPASARITDLNVDATATPVIVQAAILARAAQPGADAKVEAALERRLKRDARVTLDQYLIGSSVDLAAARNDMARLRDVAARAERDNADISRDLALLAGVNTKAVTVDNEKKRATVRAVRLPDAGLGAYRALEERMRTLWPGWTIELVPPTLSLPSVTVTNGAVADTAAANYQLLRWAARRGPLPISLSGVGAATVQEALAADGVTANLMEKAGAGDGIVTAAWQLPDGGR